MTKLLTAYAIARNAQTAKRVLAYLAKHPMAECLLSADEAKLLAELRWFMA